MSDSCEFPVDASPTRVRPGDAGETWKILIVDDEPDVRDIMAVSVEDAGYETICAPDGATGLALLAAHLPQILITDIKMPGMNGLEVLKKAKEIQPKTQVIVTTGFADMKKAVTALQYDASDFITKPVDDTTLHLALKRAMQRYLNQKELVDYTRLLEQTVLNQEKILHQEKMMSLGRLAASIVHEINNPLSGILNYIRLMIRLIQKPGWDKEGQDRFRQYLSVVNRETQRCSDLVSRLLQFSRKSGGRFEPVDVRDLLDYSLMLCNHKLVLSDIVHEITCDTDLPLVMGDFNQLQQCLINLIFNAVDAIGTTGGTAYCPGLETAEEHSGSARGRIWISATANRSDDWVYIRVKDNGRGIAARDLPHIFEPFFTTKRQGQGVGLGLSTVYGIIEHHDGIITVESEPGRGACFTIRLPRADDNQKESDHD